MDKYKILPRSSVIRRYLQQIFARSLCSVSTTLYQLICSCKLNALSDGSSCFLPLPQRGFDFVEDLKSFIQTTFGAMIVLLGKNAPPARLNRRIKHLQLQHFPSTINSIYLQDLWICKSADFGSGWQLATYPIQAKSFLLLPQDTQFSWTILRLFLE